MFWAEIIIDLSYRLNKWFGIGIKLCWGLFFRLQIHSPTQTCSRTHSVHSILFLNCSQARSWSSCLRHCGVEWYKSNSFRDKISVTRTVKLTLTQMLWCSKNPFFKLQLNRLAQWPKWSKTTIYMMRGIHELIERVTIHSLFYVAQSYSVTIQTCLALGEWNKPASNSFQESLKCCYIIVKPYTDMR
jgi:hypothetical protein